MGPAGPSTPVDWGKGRQYRPIAYVTDSDGGSYYVPINWDGIQYPGW